jgi:hypothetical protein
LTTVVQVAACCSKTLRLRSLQISWQIKMNKDLKPLRCSTLDSENRFHYGKSICAIRCLMKSY